MGAPYRQPYGSALGFQNQFSFTVGPTASGTAGLVSGTTAPNVTLGEIFYTNNTAALTINNFLLDDTANRLSQYEGKVITLVSLDGNTSVSNASPLFLNGTNGLLGANGTLQLRFSLGNWYELSRSLNNTSEVTTFVTNAQSSLNINGVRVAILNNTGSTTNKIIALSGGYVGQEITFMNIGSNAIQFIGQAGGATSSNLILINTNSLLVMASGAFKFIKHTDLNWRAIAVGSANWTTG